MDTHQRRIRRLSRILQVTSLATALLLPLVVAYLWANTDHWRTWNIAWSDAFGVAGVAPADLSASQCLMGYLTDLPALAAGSFVFVTLAGICRRYGAGELFSEDVARAYRRFARGMLAWAGLKLAGHTLLVLALTLDNPPGNRLLSISIGGDTLAMVLVGLAVHLLGKVMEEGRRLQEDNALIL